ncbi:ethanolamine utilization protein [Sebaldella sp. S0638]|uniref:ethanolamine utilization protein n=1 Tax=Sebaldella sp. S0638 TaxID=2957809 RepID=UPI0020A0F10C|nr:ethanolamine utilization protein [Sebaldella sp. S0638]MCP1225917.1 ethanolamine utilization protein [Sebaldella sp. S0638]
MDTDKLTELIKKELLRILEEKKAENEPAQIQFFGDDVLLKDELSKKVRISENGEILVISTLGINDMIDIASGKTHPAISGLLAKKTVYIVEEGLEYKRYSEPKALMETYDKYLSAIIKYGILVVKRVDLIDKMGAVTEKTVLKGVITVSKLRERNLKNAGLILDKKSIITPLAMEYIKENNIEILYERG